MNGYYKNRIKVVGDDRMCFPVHPETLEALACSCYDAYAFTDPDPEPVETISVGEWNSRRERKRCNKKLSLVGRSTTSGTYTR